VEESSISEVEIWIDGTKRGTATYGLPHAGAGGDFGFAWDWDTSGEADGMHTVIVKAFALNGGSRELPWVYNVEQTTLMVETKNWASVHKWVVR
jgi:hypothetical protein